MSAHMSSMTNKSPRTGTSRLVLVLLAVTCGPPAALVAIGLVIFSGSPAVQWIAGGLLLASLLAVVGISARQRAAASRQARL